MKQLLGEIALKGLPVLVVDDGSTDNTLLIARDCSATVIRNKNNSGKGLSLKRGITYLLKRRECDYILIMDGDGQHSPSDIDAFLSEAGRGEPFVAGNRMDNPYGMPYLRVLTNKFMSWIISRIISRDIPDSQCGFRLIKSELLEQIAIETGNYQIESEIIVKMARRGVRIKSIPVKSIYLKEAKSKIHPLIDTFRFIRFIFSVR